MIFLARIIYLDFICSSEFCLEIPPELQLIGFINTSPFKLCHNTWLGSMDLYVFFLKVKSCGTYIDSVDMVQSICVSKKFFEPRKSNGGF